GAGCGTGAWSSKALTPTSSCSSRRPWAPTRCASSRTCPEARHGCSPARPACTACSSTAARSSSTERRPASSPARCCARDATRARCRCRPEPDPVTVGARPAPVRIDDLAHPRFSPETAEILTAMAAMADGVQLEPDALMDAAMAKTGLSDFGDDAFREPLGALCTAFRNEAGLSGPGIVSNQ